MKTLKDIKEEVGRENGYTFDGWQFSLPPNLWEEIAKRYASEYAKQYAKESVNGVMLMAAEKLPSDDEIEESGKEGGLRDNELQMFWEGGTKQRDKAKNILLSLKITD